MASGQRAQLSLYLRVLREARPYRLHVAGLLVLNLLTTPLALLAPLPLTITVDSVLGGRPLPAGLHALLPSSVTASSATLLAFAVALLLAVALAGHLNGLAIWLLQTWTGEQLVLGFRSRLFRHVQRLSLAYHDSRGTSDSVYRIQYDAPAIQWIAIDGVLPFISAAFTLSGMLYVMLRIDVALAFVALSVTPVLWFLTRFYGRRLRDQWSRVKQLESSAMSVLHETLGALRVVKAFGQEEREQQRFEDQSGRSVRSQLGVAFTRGGFDLAVGVTIAAGTAAVLFVGIRHVQADKITLGQLLIVMGYLAQLYGPLQTISRKITDMQASLSSAARAFELLDQSPDVVEKRHARPIARAAGHIAFHGVDFQYGPGKTVFSNVTLDIPPGSRVGIVGRTGAGKTTLVSLLPRFYDPTAGHVALDGIDLRDLRLADLRNQFSIVLQEPVLLSTSIAENIAYARPGATREQVIAAAEAAGAHAFITRHPDAYDAQVGERGMSLSGGERQRISLARAFLKDAPILILDEPTSAVDLHTEAAIMDAMQRLMAHRTTFIIAHRLDTLRGCDIILRVQDGLVKVEDPRSLVTAKP